MQVTIILTLALAAMVNGQVINFSPVDYTVNESSGYLTLFLQASRAVPDTYVVTVITQDLDALNGTDYIGRRFPVTFPSNDNRASFNITLIDDTEPPKEDREMFAVIFDSSQFPPGVMEGETATVTILDDCTNECPDGETLDESTCDCICTRVCQNNGTLDQSTCVCNCPVGFTGVDCGNVICRSLNAPPNGNVEFTGFSEGDTATFTCNPGYELMGSATLICESDGIWSDSAPTCQIIDCGDPGNPENGRRILQGGTTFQSNVTYECNPGFSLVGVSFRTCRADGTWSGSQPSCTPIDCGDPGNPENGRRILQGGTTFQSNVTYECNPGFSLVGVLFRTCRADGTWSGSQPSCSIDCGDPGNPENGLLIILEDTTFQSNVTYECNPGFDVVGVSIRTCRANGTWSDFPPTCSPKDCGDPGNPDNGRRILQGNTTFQSNVTYECDPGFRLVGVSNQTCSADGTWSGSQPSCTSQNVTRFNDTIIGDPSYEVPVVVDAEGNKVSLCYEIRGEANQHFNLISDTCVSVNALYSSIPSGGNFIRKIGVLAEDSNGVCQEIEADLEGCTARVNGNNVTMYNQDDVLVMRRTNRIRISVPNCNNINLVMWVICEVRGEQSMIKFVVARGFNLNPTSHGLIGQFWNTKVETEKYNVTASDKISPAEGHYVVTVNTPGSTRRFFAWKLPRTWDKNSQTCLYAGDSQGNVPYEVTSLSGSVIEGTYDEYIVRDGLFATDYKYEMFDSTC